MKTHFILLSIIMITAVSCKRSVLAPARKQGMIIDPFYPYTDLQGKKDEIHYINYLGAKDNC